VEREAILVAERLTKRYGRAVVVDGVSFDVPASTTFGLLGPNGAGKTTIVRMLTGLAKPTSGRVLMFGHDMARRPNAIKQRFGHVYAAMAFFPALNAMQNLAFFGRFYRLPARRLQERIEETLRFVSLWEERRKPVDAYSSGMKQRLGIAKALVHEPDLLIFDEATNGVDVEGTNDIRELMFELRARGKTALVTSHRLDEIELLCDHIAILDEGRIVRRGSPQSIREGLRGVLFKYVVKRSTPIQEEWCGPSTTVRYIGTANVVLSEEDVRTALVARFGAGAVEEVDPTFEEACLWILKHPAADSAAPKLPEETG